MKARPFFLIFILGVRLLDVPCYAHADKVYPFNMDIDATTLARSLPLSKREELLVNYAHSKPIFDNVGELVFDGLFDIAAGGSVVFIGGNICLTAAHCYFKYVKYLKYFVHFEVNGKWTPLYNIVKFIVHDGYIDSKNNDIAILVLDRNVQELPGAPPCYDYTNEDKEFDDYTESVSFVGYGMTYMLDKWIMMEDHKRKAYGAYLSICQVSKDPKEIITQAIENIDDVEYKLAKDQQTLIPFETKGRPGVSGGGVFHPQHGLVAIHNRIKYDNKNNFTYTYILPFLRFLNNFLVLFEINTDKLLENIRSLSVPLGPYKEWIEANRLKYKLPDVNPADSKIGE